MDNQFFIIMALDVIRWEEYKRGYTSVSDLYDLKTKLREMSKGNIPFAFSITELDILKTSAQNSIAKISNYQYPSELTYDAKQKLRDEALDPLYEFAIEIKNMIAAE